MVTAKNTTRNGRHYSEEDLAMLGDMAGSYSFVQIARKLKRTPQAIERQLARMGLLHTKMSGGLISGNELAGMLGLHHKTLIKWKRLHKLPLEAKNLRFGANKNTSWHIDPVEFWKWATNNQDLVNWIRYTPGSILPEPTWLANKRREQALYMSANTRREWTGEEDKKAWTLFYAGHTQKEIGRILGRSSDAVYSRLKRLREMKLKK